MARPAACVLVSVTHDNRNARRGDPIDLGTGLFVLSKTDLVEPDFLPLNLTRTYRPNDPVSRPFGIGATFPYAMFLRSTQQYQQADLVLSDGGRVHYVRTSPGTQFNDAVFTATSTPTIFYNSTIAWNGSSRKPTAARPAACEGGGRLRLTGGLARHAILARGSRWAHFSSAPRAQISSANTSTTAGEIRAGGGTVEHVPEPTRSGAMNERHVNVCLGEGPCPFSPRQPNPISPAGRIR